MTLRGLPGDVVEVDLLLVRQDGVSVSFLEFVVLVFVVFIQEDEGLVLLQVCLRDQDSY